MINLPSVYIYGMPINSIDELIYGNLFGNATRSVGLAINLSKIGHIVYLEVENDFSLNVGECNVPENLNFVVAEDRKKAMHAADVLLVSCTNIQSFSDLFERSAYIQHPCKVIASCFDNNQKINIKLLEAEVRAITFNNQQQKSIWDRRRSLIPSFVVTYGVNEYNYVDKSIKDVAKPAALWMGGIRRKDMLQRIIRFANVNPECKVTVVTRTIFDGSIPHNERGSRNNPYGDFRGRDPLSKFDEIVREICGCEKPQNVDFQGPMEGQNHMIQGEHTIGLDFSRFPAQNHDNTKILDYLRSGLCVICDEGTPSHRFVQETGHGVVVSPSFGDDEIREAYLKSCELNSYTRRLEVASYVRENYGWQVAGNQFSEILQNAHTTVPPSTIKRALHNVSGHIFRVFRGLKKK
jgi:hypothetical protein